MKSGLAQTAGLVFLAMALTSGCAGSTTPSQTSPSRPVDTGEIDEEKENDGVFVTIDSTQRLVNHHICILESHPGFEHCHGPLIPDGDVILVETTVRNDTDQALDLSCVDELHDTLIDDQGNPYPTSGSLDLIYGNPECGELLEPGEERTMTYAYLLPVAAPFTAWTFTNGTDSKPPTTFNIADNPTKTTGRPGDDAIAV